MNNDIRKLIDDNWDEIKELIAQKAEAEQKPKTIWDFNSNDRDSYYYIDEFGYLRPDWFDEGYFEIRRDLGNAFLTEEEAEFELERRKIEAILRKYSRPFKSGEYNYVVVHDTENNRMLVRVTQFYNSGGPVFANKEVAEKAIDEIGKVRLKKYWFGVAE
ncbi:hypothetical protein [Peptostreptococcus sp.]|uniref:hypothetical protein n=1 Tax=Peptostreptococcus sp. TaxID=1262 RepID=UPI001CAD34A0|nr:hypothetical protein [Peptostreptococcus sp.]MBF1049687.1 hypothetical protein [Peptostreptococcus sp.]